MPDKIRIGEKANGMRAKRKHDLKQLVVLGVVANHALFPRDLSQESNKVHDQSQNYPARLKAKPPKSQGVKNR